MVPGAPDDTGARTLTRLLPGADQDAFVFFAVMLFSLYWSGIVWIYFAYEIIVLNTVLYVSVRKHERMCATILKEEA